MKLTVLISVGVCAAWFVLWAFCRAAASTPPLSLPKRDPFDIEVEALLDAAAHS